MPRPRRPRRPSRRPSRVPPGAAVLLVALVGLAALGAALALDAAREVALGELAAHEGARVAVAARVLAVSPRALQLADATARVVAFPPSGALPAPGDEVRAVGTVTRAAGGLALDLERVAVLARPHERVLAPGDLAREPSRYAGGPVAVAGLLDRPVGEGWRLLDAWTGASVALRVAPVPPEWEPGRAVRVEGRFALEDRLLRYEVRVDAWRPSASS